MESGRLIPPAEELEVAVRGWAPPDYRRHLPPPNDELGWIDLGPSEWSVCFDCETTADAAQRLRFGAYQVRRGDLLAESGLFYTPGGITDTELILLRTYTEQHGLRLLTTAEFVERVLLRYCYDLRGLLVGFNLPFDISRIALAHYKTRSRVRKMRGGFSFPLSADDRRPVVQVRRVGARAAFIRFADPGGRPPERRNREAGGQTAPFDGYVVDVQTLAAALLSHKGGLGPLADLLGTEHRKGDFEDFDSPITPEMLDYGLGDVQVTWECFQALRDRYATYRLTQTPYWRVLSEASVGKAHLKEMGLRPWRATQADFPDWLLAIVMETYYGGRAECRIRLTPLPGVLVDFASQYPTVFALQELWEFQIAQRIEWAEEDPAIAQAILSEVTPERVLDLGFWPHLHRLVLIEPDSDRLPTRARFGRSIGRPAPWNVAVCTRVGGPAQWWTLADAAASTLETDRPPKVLRSIRFTAGPPQAALRPLDIAGDPNYRVNPYTDNGVRRLVELRAHFKTLRDQARNAGDEAAYRRFDAIQQGLKIAANAVAYGIGIELNSQDHAKKVGVTIHHPDGSALHQRLPRSENPGTWFHPIIATQVAAGGRLLLATAMRLVHQAGGDYMFCDTDSLNIGATREGGTLPCPGAPGGQITLLSWQQVQEITRQFETLNPYNPELIPGSILRIEDINRDRATGAQRPVHCLSVAAKRYALYEGPDGRPRIVGKAGERKRCEHGLGHLLPPTGRKGKDWITPWWEHLIALELGIDDPEPEWFGLAAIGRLTLASHHEADTFTAYNHTRPYQEQVRPFGFLNIAHPDPIEVALPDGPRCLIAPYDRDPRRRMGRAWWFDRHRPDRQPRTIRTGHPEEQIDGEIAVQSYRDYFHTYRRHPEAKTAAPDGNPCRPRTRGLLQPRSIHASEIVRVGKEANRAGGNPDLALDPQDHPIQYPEQPTCQGCGTSLTGRQRRWCGDVCRKHQERKRQP
ncbi:MAG: hypothetical protein JW785_06140 [Acidimicrobiia bacterium]|nr:hypothetical protein [Acidimicrobiia bacterium]